MKTLAIWTDGGCRVNPGIGGWGFGIPDFFNVKSFGYSRKTTNNAMEISAILEALKVVVKASNRRQLSEYDTIVIHSDSSYCINTFEKWVYKWIRKNNLKEKKNWELIYKVYILMEYLMAAGWKIHFHKVPGHCGVEGNEIADKLANQAMDEKLSFPVPKSIIGRTAITITTFADKYFKNEEDKKRLIDILNE